MCKYIFDEAQKLRSQIQTPHLDKHVKIARTKPNNNQLELLISVEHKLINFQLYDGEFDA